MHHQAERVWRKKGELEDFSLVLKLDGFYPHIGFGDILIPFPLPSPTSLAASVLQFPIYPLLATTDLFPLPPFQLEANVISPKNLPHLSENEWKLVPKMVSKAFRGFRQNDRESN